MIFELSSYLVRWQDDDGLWNEKQVKAPDPIKAIIVAGLDINKPGIVVRPV